MKKNYILLYAVGLILLIAVLTNPNQDQHKEAVKAKYNSYIQKRMSEGLSEKDSELKNLGMLLGRTLINGIVSNTVTVDNYVFFSTTKISWDGESKIIGVGLFGNVFLTKKLDEVLYEGLLSK